MNPIDKTLARLKVILTAAVTYLVLAATVLTIVSESLPAAPGTIAKVLAWLGTAVLIIRRVTPVLPDERGVLPQD